MNFRNLNYLFGSFFVGALSFTACSSEVKDHRKNYRTASGSEDNSNDKQAEMGFAAPYVTPVPSASPVNTAAPVLPKWVSPCANMGDPVNNRTPKGGKTPSDICVICFEGFGIGSVMKADCAVDKYCQLPKNYWDAKSDKTIALSPGKTESIWCNVAIPKPFTPDEQKP